MSRRLWKHNLISLDLVAWFKCKHWTGANSAEHPVLPLGWYKHDWSGRKSSCSNLNQLSPIDWGSKDNASASARAALKVNDSSHRWTFCHHLRFIRGQQTTSTTVLCLSASVLALVNKMFVFACGCDLRDSPRSSASAMELRGVMRENKLKAGQNQYRLPNRLAARVYAYGCVYVCVCSRARLCVFTWSVTAFNVSSWGKTTNCLSAHALLNSGTHTHTLQAYCLVEGRNRFKAIRVVYFSARNPLWSFSAQLANYP